MILRLRTLTRLHVCFFLPARIIAGVFGGVIGAQVLSIVADMFTYERRGRAMGIVMGGFAGASILGVIVKQHRLSRLMMVHIL